MWNPFSDTAKGAVEGFGTAIKEAVGAFKADPTKVAEFIASVELASTQLVATTITAVNTTMQAEAKSEHWMQWSWRPMFGYTACAILINNYVLLPYLTKFGVVPIAVPENVWLMIMAVLGVAAWSRSMTK